MTDEEQPSPVLHLSDGPVLVLADGSVVRPLLQDGNRTKLVQWGHDQGSAVYGREVDEDYAALAFIQDPDAEDVEAVEGVLDAYDF